MVPLILILTSCGPSGSPSLAQPLRQKLYVDDENLSTLPADVRQLLRPVIAMQDVIRGFWGTYPFEPNIGRRVDIQVSAQIWVEIYPSGQITKFIVEGRGRVQDQPGTLMLRLRRDGQSLPSSDGLQLEGFLPDSTQQAKASLFRVRNHGNWGPWTTGVVLYRFK